MGVFVFVSVVVVVVVVRGGKRGVRRRWGLSVQGGGDLGKESGGRDVGGTWALIGNDRIGRAVSLDDNGRVRLRLQTQRIRFSSAIILITSPPSSSSNKFPNPIFSSFPSPPS